MDPDGSPWASQPGHRSRDRRVASRSNSPPPFLEESRAPNAPTAESYSGVLQVPRNLTLLHSSCVNSSATSLVPVLACLSRSSRSMPRSCGAARPQRQAQRSRRRSPSPPHHREVDLAQRRVVRIRRSRLVPPPLVPALAQVRGKLIQLRRGPATPCTTCSGTAAPGACSAPGSSPTARARRSRSPRC